MAVPKQKQDELWELGQERGERPVLESILRRYYPEKAEGILRLADEQGDTAVFDGMLRQMMDDGHFGEPFVAPITPPGFGDLRVAEEQQAKEIETVVEPKRQQEAQPAKQVVAEPLRMQPQPAADVVELRQQEAKLETPFDRETSRKLRQQGYSEKEIQDMLPVIRGESVPHMATDKDMSPLEVPVTPPRRDMLAGSAHMPQRMEEGEVLGRAKPGEALVGAAKHLGLHLFDDFNKKYVQPYKTAKEVLWDVPMHKVEPKIAEGIRRGIAGMRRNMIYLPSVEDAKELIEARNWKAVGEMAKAGRFPTAEELGLSISSRS